MNKIFFIGILLFGEILDTYAQQKVALISNRDMGPISLWDVVTTHGVIATAYSIEKTGTMNISFYPGREDTAGATLVLTGTYTSYDGQVAGKAYTYDCQDIGNENDSLFNPNAYLVFNRSRYSNIENRMPVFFSPIDALHHCNAIPVYQIMNEGVIDSATITQRTHATTLWRVLVQKQWTMEYRPKVTRGISGENGTDYLIIDFLKPMTITEVCAVIQGLERKELYATGYYTSRMSACLLDTGSYRPFLLRGKNMHGVFSLQHQTNCIVVK